MRNLHPPRGIEEPAPSEGRKDLAVTPRFARGPKTGLGTVLTSKRLKPGGVPRCLPQASGPLRSNVQR